MATYILAKLSNSKYTAYDVIMKTHNVKEIFKYEKNLLGDRQLAEKLRSNPHFLYVINGTKMAVLTYFDLNTRFNSQEIEIFFLYENRERIKYLNELMFYIFEVNKFIDIWCKWDELDSIDEIEID